MLHSHTITHTHSCIHATQGHTLFSYACKHTHTHTHLCKHSIHTAYYTHSAHANTQYTLLIKRSPHHANTQYTLLIKHPPHHANTQYTLIIIIHTLHHATLSTHSLYKHCTMQTLNTHSLSHNTLHHANIQYTLCITHTHTLHLANTYMPTPKLCSQEQKSPKSRTQNNFPEHISKCIPTFMK